MQSESCAERKYTEGKVVLGETIQSEAVLR